MGSWTEWSVRAEFTKEDPGRVSIKILCPRENLEELLAYAESGIVALENGRRHWSLNP